MEIEISDDGCGFDTGKFKSGLTSEGCFGLFSIRERLSYVGGSMVIESEPEQGTCVTISTPYRAVTEESDG